MLEQKKNEMVNNEKNLVVKNEHENIHKVFDIKGLNYKFKSFIKGVNLKVVPEIKKSKNKNYLKAIVISVLIVINILLFVLSLEIRYKVYMDSEFVGIIADKNQISDILDQACKQISSDIQAEIYFDVNLELKPLISYKSQEINISNIINNLKAKGLYKEKGYAIYANGKELVVMPNNMMAQNLLQKMKESFNENSDTNMKFLQSIEIKEKTLKEFKYISLDEALRILNENKNQFKTYKVQKGDSLWIIAKNNGMTINEIKKFNPGLGDIIREGQEIKLRNSKPIIDIHINDTSNKNKQPYAMK